MPNPTPFVVDPVLTGIVQAYQNNDLIADEVFPRIGPLLPRQIFKWTKFEYGQFMAQYNTRVGRKGTPDTIEFTGTDQTSGTDDYALRDIVPQDDRTQAPNGYDPVAFAAQKVMDLVLLDREVRCAGLAFTAANYAATNKTLLSGTSQWSNASSTPIIDIENARSGMIMDPNRMVIGRAAWSKLRTNPSILQAISISGTDKGMATLQAVQDLFEIEKIIVGSAWVNSAKPGQASTLLRAWGKHALLFRQNKLAKSVGEMPTYGWTAEYGGKVSGTVENKPGTDSAGLRGSTTVVAGESVKEVICAADLAFFFENAVA
jgi:hypothetical protein